MLQVIISLVVIGLVWGSQGIVWFIGSLLIFLFMCLLNAALEGMATQAFEDKQIAIGLFNKLTDEGGGISLELQAGAMYEGYPVRCRQIMDIKKLRHEEMLQVEIYTNLKKAKRGWMPCTKYRAKTMLKFAKNEPIVKPSKRR